VQVAFLPGSIGRTGNPQLGLASRDQMLMLRLRAQYVITAVDVDDFTGSHRKVA
jgi:hypothetical protein